MGMLIHGQRQGGRLMGVVGFEKNKKTKKNFQ